MSDARDDLTKALREIGDELGRGIESLGRLAKQAGEDWKRAAGPLGGRSADQPVSSTPIRMIRELAALRDEGYITDEEYEAKKAELLERV